MQGNSVSYLMLAAIKRSPVTKKIEKEMIKSCYQSPRYKRYKRLTNEKLLKSLFKRKVDREIELIHLLCFTVITCILLLIIAHNFEICCSFSKGRKRAGSSEGGKGTDNRRERFDNQRTTV